MTQDDLDYYIRRRDEEQQSAAKAPSNEVRAVHAHLVRLYAERIKTLTAHQESPSSG